MDVTGMIITFVLIDTVMIILITKPMHAQEFRRAKWSLLPWW